MTKVVAVIAQKGGVGKTTNTTHLAWLAEESGAKAAIIDADPQGTASDWYGRRQKQQGKSTPLMSGAPTPELLKQAVQAARSANYDYVFIDTPANGESPIPPTAAALADLVLMPCVPSMGNMDALKTSVRIVKRTKTPAYFFINRGRSQRINDECLVGLTSAYGLPAIKVHISDRRPVMNAEGPGITLFEDTSADPAVVNSQQEFRALWRWVEKYLNSHDTEPAAAEEEPEPTTTTGEN
jgi:chromosome partitioning protein